MVRLMQTEKTTVIPDGVTVTVKSRKITVKGPRGELSKDFTHVSADMFIRENEGKKILVVKMFFAPTKSLSSLRTVVSHVANMITGVTTGFRYKMRCVHAHFPINITVADAGKTVEIRNFLGEKRKRVVPMAEGCSIKMSTDVKDELVIEGNNIDGVSNSCQRINQCCLVKKKDIRKFLDGIYISHRGLIE